jgi:hypothetical protein
MDVHFPIITRKDSVDKSLTNGSQNRHLNLLFSISTSCRAEEQHVSRECTCLRRLENYTFLTLAIRIAETNVSERPKR